jgi:hypothetical protein
LSLRARSDALFSARGAPSEESQVETPPVAGPRSPHVPQKRNAGGRRCGDAGRRLCPSRGARANLKAAAPGPIQTAFETSPPEKDRQTQTTSGGDFMVDVLKTLPVRVRPRTWRSSKTDAVLPPKGGIAEGVVRRWEGGLRLRLFRPTQGCHIMRLIRAPHGGNLGANSWRQPILAQDRDRT